jgi:hypothetical protein
MFKTFRSSGIELKDSPRELPQSINFVTHLGVFLFESLPVLYW